MDNIIEVKEIIESEIEQAAITLFNAFENDALIQWIFGDKRLYTQQGIPVFKTWIKYCVLYGKAFRTNHFEAVALRKKPGDNKFTFWRMWRSGMLKAPALLGKAAFKRLMQFDELTAQMKEKLGTRQNFWCCWMLGTKQTLQKKGYGKALMAHTFNLAKQDKLPCYLETASKISKQIHFHAGYKMVAEAVLPESNIKITGMLRD